MTMTDAARALSFPRVSGDEPFTPEGKVMLCGFSPRERG